jgi:carbonic anhydrase
MTDFPQRLAEGYRAFACEQLPSQQERLLELSEHGQAPETMVISCCDSRVTPENVFAAPPGELFVVRNIANLVPPCMPDSVYDGIAAAIDYAVEHLKVKQIVVLGHAQCGGVHAFAGHAGHRPQEDVIGKWVDVMAPAVRKARHRGNTSFSQYLTRLEQASIENSLENLMTYPEVRDKVASGELALYGAYFVIKTGELMVRDPSTGAFEPASREVVIDAAPEQSEQRADAVE